MAHHFNGDLRSELRLVQLLEAATGLDAVPTTSHPEANASADVIVEQATLQRFALQARGEGLALCTWPAELKAQAKAFYQADQVARFLNFLTEKDQAWRAGPMPQLAFRSAAASQRVFLHCHLGIDEYVRRWLGDDFACVGAHERDRIWPNLWPWLLEHGYADPVDEQPLEALLTRLGKRDVFLRPGIAMERIWSWAEAEDLDERGAVADEISAAITSALTVLGEPLIPVRAATDPAATEVTRRALEEVLIDRARWTYTRLSNGRRNRVELHEETITQDLLLDIAMAMPAMTVKTFTKREEGRNGADWQWEWWFEGRQWFGLRVQAKRLKLLKSRRFGYDLGYQSGRQLELLVRDAARFRMRAAYVLYNGGPDLDLSPFRDGCGRFPWEPESFGVTVLPASVARDLVDRGRDDFAAVASASRPWSCLATCAWAECGRSERYGDELQGEDRGGDLSELAAISFQRIEGKRSMYPARGDFSELGLLDRPPAHVENLLSRDTTDASANSRVDGLRFPARVGAVTIFRTGS